MQPKRVVLWLFFGLAAFLVVSELQLTGKISTRHSQKLLVHPASVGHPQNGVWTLPRRVPNDHLEEYVEPNPQLDELLAKVSAPYEDDKPGKASIMVTVVDAMGSEALLPTFLESLQRLPGRLDQRLLVVATDVRAQDTCLAKHQHCLLHSPRSRMGAGQLGAASAAALGQDADGDVDAAAEDDNEGTDLTSTARRRLLERTAEGQTGGSHRLGQLASLLGWQQLASAAQRRQLGLNGVGEDCRSAQGAHQLLLPQAGQLGEQLPQPGQQQGQPVQHHPHLPVLQQLSAAAEAVRLWIASTLTLGQLGRASPAGAGELVAGKPPAGSSRQAGGRRRLLRQGLKRRKKRAKAARNARLTDPAFLQIGWDRVALLHAIVQRGHSVLFVDADLVWLKDPFPALEASRSDIQLSVDGYDARQEPPSKRPNVGLMFVRPTPQAAAFLAAWLGLRYGLQAREQFEFPNAWAATAKTHPDLRIKYLDTDRFPNGCCCGTKVEIREERWDPHNVPPDVRSRWVMWHAACVPTILRKQHYLSNLLDAVP